MNARSLLNTVFQQRWNAPALICDQGQFTYATVYAHAAGIAQWLATQGCPAGSTIGVCLPNGWPFAVTYIAGLIGRYCLVPINPELSVEDQTYIVQRTQPKIVLRDEQALRQVRPCHVGQPHFETPNDLHTARDHVDAIFFTSGTTGRPKGVCHTLTTFVDNVIHFNTSQVLDENTRLYHVLPMAYMAGFLNTLLSPWLAGGTVLLGPRFQPADALQFWTRALAWHANSIWLTPTLAAVLTKMHRDPDSAQQIGRSMTRVFCGTAPLPEVTRHAFQATFGCPLQASYGMSEVLLVSAQTPEQAQHSTGVGSPLPGIRLESRSHADSSTEELIIYTPWTLLTYLLETGESSPLTPDGGMPSGDNGVLKEGELHITGRLKDLIIRGGINVSPVAVENVLCREPAVQDVAVIGLPHDFWGEIVVACIVAEPSADTNALQKTLHQRCLNELSHGMQPDRYVWLEHLPRTQTGKTQKHALRKALL